MKSPEYILHGTSSEEDAQKIEEEGFDAKEGRSTVSTDLLMAFNWSSDTGKRKASKSESEVEESEKGRILIMRVPEGVSADYGDDTSIDIGESRKEVSGFVSRYENNRRYLALYSDFEKESQGINVGKENILMSIVPSSELEDTLDELKKTIKKLEKIDIDYFVDEIIKVVKSNPKNYVVEGEDISEIIHSLVVSTIESEVIRQIRTLSIDIKRANGYNIYNKGENVTRERLVEKDRLKGALEKVVSIVDGENFDLGLENLNRYIKFNAHKLLKDLEDKTP